MLKMILYTIVYSLISGYGLYKIKLIEQVWPLNSNLILGVIFYGFGFILWIVMLKKFPLSVAYPIATGGLLIVTQLFGTIFLKESMGIVKLLGVLFILIGTVMVTSYIGE